MGWLVPLQLPPSDVGSLRFGPGVLLVFRLGRAVKINCVARPLVLLRSNIAAFSGSCRGPCFLFRVTWKPLWGERPQASVRCQVGVILDLYLELQQKQNNAMRNPGTSPMLTLALYCMKTGFPHLQNRGLFTIIPYAAQTEPTSSC